MRSLELCAWTCSDLIFLAVEDVTSWKCFVCGNNYKSNSWNHAQFAWRKMQKEVQKILKIKDSFCLLWIGENGSRGKLLVVVLCRTSFLKSSYLRTFAEILSTVWAICCAISGLIPVQDVDSDHTLSGMALVFAKSMVMTWGTQVCWKLLACLEGIWCLWNPCQCDALGEVFKKQNLCFCSCADCQHLYSRCLKRALLRKNGILICFDRLSPSEKQFWYTCV
jgi:hypothetical protein